MRQKSCRWEIKRALMPPGCRRALAFACLGAAWIAVSGSTMARDSAHTPPGRPVPGHGLSQLLFPLTATAKNEEVPEDPTTMSPATLPNTATQQPAANKQSATTLLQQPGYVSPG